MTFIDKSYWCAAVSNAEVKVRTGICAHEKNGPQLLRIEVKMYLPISMIISPNRIEDVADYDRVYKAIQALEDQPHTDLLEQIVIEIAVVCFEDQRISAVEITITKPEIYNGIATPHVTLAITREDWNKYFHKLK